MATRFMAARWFLSSEVSTVRSGRAYTLLVVPCVQTRAYGLGHYVFRVYAPTYRHFSGAPHHVFHATLPARYFPALAGSSRGRTF